MNEAELRRTLEDAAELLDATRLQLSALVPALESWRWKSRVRALSDVAREVVRTERVSRSALARARRRAEVESWPSGPLRHALDELAALFLRLDEVLTERGFPDLATLVRHLVGVSRAVPLTEREAAAAEVLHPDEPELQVLATFGAALEALFSRPLLRAKRLPFSLVEFDALRAQWAEGHRALEACWARVAALDTTGGVERSLRRRARMAPRATRGHPGPRVFVHAAYWAGFAQAQVNHVVAERFAPVTVRPEEALDAFRFLLAREVDGSASLEPATRDASPERLSAPRAALLMLAHELTAVPEGRAPLARGQAQVRAWAEAADALEGDDDWRRLRDQLRALTVRSFGATLPPLYRVGVPTPPPSPVPQRLADFFTVARQT